MTAVLLLTGSAIFRCGSLADFAAKLAHFSPLSPQSI